MAIWTAILEQLAKFLAVFMQWWQQNQLIQAGKDQQSLEQLKTEAELRSKLDAIDASQPRTDPKSILDSL